MGGPQTVSIIKTINPYNHNANIPIGQPKGGNKINFIVGYQNTLWPAIICVTLHTPSTYLMKSPNSTVRMEVAFERKAVVSFPQGHPGPQLVT